MYSLAYGEREFVKKATRSLSRIRISLLSCILGITILVPLVASADSARIDEYVYDGAGNIVSIRSGINIGPPEITLLSPAFIHQESFAFVTVTGLNLLNATIETSTPGLEIIFSNNISETEMFVTLYADQSSTLGNGLLTFTTRLGSDSETIIIAERTPVISTDPNPVVLLPDHQVKQVSLLFDRPFETDQVFDVLISDTSIATIAETSITLPAGQHEVSVSVSGINTGSTQLEVNQLSKFLALGIPVIVSDPVQLPAGNFFASSKPLGITVSRFYLPSGNNKIKSKPLGVVRNSLDLSNGNHRVVSDVLGVVRNSFDQLNGNNQVISPTLGVVRKSLDFQTGQQQVISEPLGIIIEPNAEQITPTQMFSGTSNTLIVTGSALDQVTSVSFVPDHNITQTVPFSVNSTGTQLSIFIDVSSVTTASLRQIILTTLNGEIAFSIAGGDVLEISP